MLIYDYPVGVLAQRHRQQNNNTYEKTKICHRRRHRLLS
jgi:hypothetical protein